MKQPEPSLEARLIARTILEGFAAPYFAVNPEKIETRIRITIEAARAVDTTLRDINRAVRESMATNPT